MVSHDDDRLPTMVEELCNTTLDRPQLAPDMVGYAPIVLVAVGVYRPELCPGVARWVAQIVASALSW